MSKAQCELDHLVGDLGALLASGAGADIHLLVGDVRLPAHRALLTARSPVFASMLRHDTKEARDGTVRMAEEEEVVRQLLHFIYTGRVPGMDDVAAELLVAADKYGLPILKQSCEWKVVDGITVENAAAAAVLAVKLSCPTLKERVVSFIKDNMEVMGTDGWQKVMQNDVQVAVEICAILSGTRESSGSGKLKRRRTMASTVHGAPANKLSAKDAYVQRKLCEAASEGRVDELRTLLVAGVDVDARGDKGRTPLHCAAENGRDDAVVCLLRAGADTEARDGQLGTPLHLAAGNSKCGVVRILLGAQAGLEARNKKGETALHLAAARPYTGPSYQSNSSSQLTQDVATVLLNAGADKLVKDNSGKRPEL